MSLSSRRVLLAAAVSTVAFGADAASAMATAGAVYSQTNDPAGNVVHAFARDGQGTLTPAGAFRTGGVGSSTLGGRQGAVELSDDERYVFAVNAGSNTVSVFRTSPRTGGLTSLGSTSSGGVLPASVDEHQGRLYVLNAGGSPNVAAFAVGADGTLTPIASQELLGALGAAQVSVTSSGDALIVSERGSNRLETLALDAAGAPGVPVITASSGAVPFGFAITRHDVVVVSEAGDSTVSSYALGTGGALTTITASAPVGQGAACWVAISPDGKHAYTGNAAGSISGYHVEHDGSLVALDSDGLTAALTPSPRDLDFARDGRYLYAISPGGTSTGGRVTGYRVAADGTLTRVTQVNAAVGLTGAAAG